MVRSPIRSPVRSPTDSEVTIRASDWRTPSPSTPRVRIIPPTPLEGPARLPDEPEYFGGAVEEEEERGWWTTVAGWAGMACFLPVKLCVYASRASKSGTVASRVA
ncbi:uncharacterized protein COLE_07812 [Cutaneotrichosporon oleaginosum]|nr:hypothetical protein COLE_07812 [Cutaneotrichosporon oleaginosum]